MRAGATPVLIPNTTVKTCTADGTILETVWKSRWLPDLFIKHCCKSDERAGAISSRSLMADTAGRMRTTVLREYLEN